MRVGDAVAILHDGLTVSLPLTLTASLNGTCCEISANCTQDEENRLLGTWDIRYLAPEVAGTWTGLVAGLFAQRGGRIKVPWFEQVPAVGPSESGASATGTL
jgi:hypothetical protein